METLKAKISKDYVDAFKSGQKVKKNLLGVVKAEITTKEKNSNVENLDDKEVNDILKSISKKLKETLSMVSDAQSQEELEVIEAYLPKQMSENEIRVAVEQIVVEIDAKSGDMGKVMGGFNSKYSGKADNKLVSTIVKDVLSKV